MEYRKIGKWGARVSTVGLGSWLTYGGAMDESQSVKLMKEAYELGINFFDTANVYAHGQAEVVVGKALSAMRRDSVFVASKVFFPMDNGPNDRGLSRKHVFEQCHLSLKRLNMEYIDLYQCHRPDPEVPMYELVRSMDDLTRQGKILYWGVSEWTSEQIEEAVQTAYSLNAMPPVSNQPQYNMLWRHIENDVLPTSKQLGLGQVVWSPLAQGVLTGKYKAGQAPPKDSRAADERQNFFLVGRETMSRETLELVQELVKVADDAGITMAQLALAWCLRLPEITSVIIGATKSSQLEENVKAASLRFGDNVWSRVENLLSSTSRR
jgi:voltage-dependent potassium channel beta subunit